MPDARIGRLWRFAFRGNPARHVDSESLSKKDRAAPRGDGERRRVEELRKAPLLHALKCRQPDGRIGTSLLAFRLSDAELDGMLRP